MNRPKFRTVATSEVVASRTLLETVLGNPYEYVSLTPLGKKALERSTENAVRLAELFSAHSRKRGRAAAPDKLARRPV